MGARWSWARASPRAAGPRRRRASLVHLLRAAVAVRCSSSCRDRRRRPRARARARRPETTTCSPQPTPATPRRAPSLRSSDALAATHCAAPPSHGNAASARRCGDVAGCRAARRDVPPPLPRRAALTDRPCCAPHCSAGVARRAGCRAHSAYGAAAGRLLPRPARAAWRPVGPRIVRGVPSCSARWRVPTSSSNGARSQGLKPAGADGLARSLRAPCVRTASA